MPTQKKIIAGGLICLVLLLIVTLAPLIFIKTEPLYIVENHDEYPHNATITVTGYNGEYTEVTNYQLDPGQSASGEKPDYLLLKWSIPFVSTGDYSYYIEAENMSATYNSTPHLVNVVIFELVNESEKLNISVMESS
ncbi:hypothetical protein C7960_0966 [Methanohalophilus euhalobius]|uniref:Uncharacterized protein n=1 Tax=Methanohalophilus euhalobius TaxID=51203 RepID=A0A285FZ55_9EURY|nr:MULTISPECIES: hypothetical protein [Methanohalophilus]ODV50376.1 MAG: hypothetical protein A8273_380 [Methanohalophilus sp. 2-GBenrich]TCL11778.1 hypothetical protein C7960_0966 [Methanohalophilus euhalobius]SNY16373.1 hypothetical protein SAMN06295989_105126 [Methanohalophilus euhalobius]